MLLVLYLILHLITFANAIYISQNGYYHISNYPDNSYKDNYYKNNKLDCLMINNSKYRESIFKSKLNIVLYLHNMNYNIATCSGNPVTVKKIDGNTLSTNCNLRSDILIRPNKTVELCNLEMLPKLKVFPAYFLCF